MPFKPHYAIAGEKPGPQFFLRDRGGREYGVVEYYDVDPLARAECALLEFVTADASASRPKVWLDLEKWEVLAGHGRDLPDADFEAGLQAYLARWPESERQRRRERCRRARRSQAIALAESGYTLAYQEFFPDKAKREDYPIVSVEGQEYLVDDQYHVRPGDLRSQVTLVFVPRPPPPGEPEAALVANWIFAGEYEIVRSRFADPAAHAALHGLMGNRELRALYQGRLQEMRREAALLGVKPAPYAPRSQA